MTMKKMLCLILALCMCLSLAACGKGGEKPESGAKNEPVEEHPEFVYNAEYKSLVEGTKNFLSFRGYTGDGFYVSSTEKTGENVPEGVTPRYEGQYDVYSSFIYFVDESGKMEKIEGYTSLPPKTDEEGKREFMSNANLSGFCFTDDGFVTVEMVYSSWNEGDANVVEYSDQYWENQRYEQEYYIRWFDKAGNELSCAPIPVSQDSYLDAYRMKLDGKGNVLVTTGAGIKAIAPDGSDAYVIEYDGYVDGIINLADGSVGIFAWNDSQGGYLIHKIDPETGSFDEGSPVNGDVYNACQGNGEYDFFCTNGTNFYGYKLGQAEPEKLFNWINCDVNGTQVNVLGVSADGAVTGVISDWNDKDQTTDYELVTVSKVPYDSVPHKENLTMAAIYLDYNVQDMIVRFNRSNKDYRVEILDYSEAVDGDWEAGLNKLNTEIMSGNVPDIFCLNGLNYTQLASKGILEDLYPYIDADPELDRSDFFPNILGAMEVGGKLCTTISGVYINSVIGASSVVGDTPGWTYDEFNEALSNMPEGCTAFDEYVTRSDILQNCLALDMDYFVDWGSGECNFNSEQFISLLEFAKSFPAEFDWDNYSWETAASTEDRLASGQQMLVQTSAYSIDDIFYNNYTSFMGSPITYIGYPTYSGTGNMFNITESGYAMSSKTEHKDAVWQLLREFFTKEYQEEYVYSISSRIDVFEDKAKLATTIEYQKDAEGNNILDENGEPIPIVRYGMWNQHTQQPVEIYCLTEEQVDQIRELLETTTKMADYDNSIIQIVTEGAAPFFEGQKSAEDVAKLIQSKVNIYVNEQR